jgi:hypothetical protein
LNGNTDETVHSNENSTSSDSSDSRQLSNSPRSGPRSSHENETFYESDRTVIAPPNTPNKERYDSSPERDDQTGHSYSPSPPNAFDRAFKVSKFAQELRAVLGQCHPSPSTHQEPQELSFRLHNLGYEDYDRVENWRYHVFYESSMPLTLDTEHKYFAHATRGRINSNSGPFPRERNCKRARSVPWKNSSGTRSKVRSAGSSSSQTGEEKDATLIQRMGRMNWQESPTKYDIPKPKFLQKLFV